MKGSLIIVAFFAAGILCGRADVLPQWVSSSTVSMTALCALLLCVGMGIGSNPDMKSEFRSLNPRVALLPLATILGSWAGAAIAFLVLQRTITDCLAISSGFAYYSLSSIFLSEYRGIELGTIALVANLVREAITLLGTPLLARIFGPLAPISAGGATTMDTTLPIITHTCGQRFTILAIFHGFIVDFSVPFLVTFWCMM
ncbi:MAG: lysine exporter LysO family protein [Prevotella sp.]|nr:lysine exporter LysO family protein [Prevotella sp.]